MTKRDVFLQERQSGLTCQEIANKYGVSKQYVSQLCSKHNPSYFHHWSSTACVYPNVRRWLNDNKITCAELLRRLNLSNHSANHIRFRGYLSGKCYPPKQTIDNLLAVTGLTYEQFWKRGEL